MSDHYTVLALFKKVDTITRSIDNVIREFETVDGDMEVLTSAALPDGVVIDDKTLEHQVQYRQYLFPFILGICGFVTGVALAGGTSWIVNLNVGGKAAFSFAPTGIITYEFSLLFGVIGSVLSLLYFAGLPNWTDRAYDPEITDGALGLLVKLKTREEQEKAAALLTDSGAYKIRKGENDF